MLIRFKLAWRLWQIFWSWNYPTAAGYWIGHRLHSNRIYAEHIYVDRVIREQISEVASTYQRRVSYHLGYAFFLADLRKGYFL